ncbi:MAG: hypothetical protein K2X47_02495 [Bdellovibrionales bacterium]|nr:hypothetical protein [Bdellovibrionales bacterium]
MLNPMLIAALFLPNIGFSSTLPTCTLPPEGQLVSLVGETHQSPTAVASGAYLDQKAKAGEILLAVEGRTYTGLPDKIDGNYGFEDEFAFGFSGLFKNYIDTGYYLQRFYRTNDRRKPTLADVLELHKTLGALVLSNSYVKEAWLSLKDLPAETDEHRATLSPLISPNLTNVPKIPGNFVAGLDLAARMLMAFAARAVREPWRTRFEVPQSTTSDVKNFLDGDFVNSSKKFVLQWRNIFISKNLQKLACRAAALKIPLVVKIGSGHLNGLEILLKENSGLRVKLLEDFLVLSGYLFKP